MRSSFLRCRELLLGWHISCAGWVLRSGGLARGVTGRGASALPGRKATDDETCLETWSAKASSAEASMGRIMIALVVIAMGFALSPQPAAQPNSAAADEQ